MPGLEDSCSYAWTASSFVLHFTVLFFWLVVGSAFDQHQGYWQQPRRRNDSAYAGYLKSWLKQLFNLAHAFCFSGRCPRKSKSPVLAKLKRKCAYLGHGRLLHRSSRLARMVAVLCFMAQHHVTQAQSKASTDSDSEPIRIDNHATCCISNRKSDFVGPLKPAKVPITGYQARKSTA